MLRKCLQEYVFGTFVVPLWESADYWPLLKPGGEWHPFIVDSLILEHGKRWLKRGRYPFSLLGSEGFTGRLIAFRIAS